ncbi:hypothetical protein [Paraburkholderia sp. C35]|uniref:hypothetical protein n=1 Tax=Paraburkholderia sp. C35 TaxID=2126993 RepID=UPI000D686606|nr:hypothetical protein [Paraburkholderia sp. C35]
MNTLLKLGAATLLLLGVALSVALIVTILSNENAPSDDGTRSVAAAQAQTPAAPENDATYGLDLDKQTVARSKATLDARDGVQR